MKLHQKLSLVVMTVLLAASIMHPSASAASPQSGVFTASFTVDALLISGSPPSLTVESTPATARVRTGTIPDNAVIEKLEFSSGRVQTGQSTAWGTILTTGIKLTPPGGSTCEKQWSANGPVTFTASELGSTMLSARGDYTVSYLGRNLSTRHPGFKAHKDLRLKIYWRVVDEPAPEE